MEIQGLDFGVNPKGKIDNIFNDGIGFVEEYDFSTANLNEKSRIHAISAVASICYQNPKAINSESLYNRLLAESKGLPSSSAEFVPVLFNEYDLGNMIISRTDYSMEDLNIYKYGEKIGNNYLLTNYRAVVNDFENYGIDLRSHFNTQEECKIIEDYFKVFLYKVDLPTRSQMVRHRVSWQELSRRYVSGSRVPFEFYVSEKMKNVKSFSNPYGYECDTQDIIRICLDHYDEAIAAGVKPQEARRIIPQAAYTQIWGAFQPKQLENYFKLRLDESSQWEIRQTAISMQELINK